jgi:small subunit ribosomal protein S18
MSKQILKDNEFNIEGIESVNYKDTKFLTNFISDQGKILPRRTTGLNSKQQKRITKLIKRARIAVLLPFVIGRA